MTEQETPRKAIILAAGIGRRLVGWAGPKVLLPFGGQTLLERHLAILAGNGVRQIYITVGHHHEAIRDELNRVDSACDVELVFNPEFDQGSILSLYRQTAALTSGESLLLMDGDVLYDSEMIPRLIRSRHENVLLLDREIEPGDEPVKICFRDGLITDFRKVPTQPFDSFGESVGFFRFSPTMACELADRLQFHVKKGNHSYEYEEAIRDLILEYPHRFGAEEISDLSWTEIDFASDVDRARDVVLPAIKV